MLIHVHIWTKKNVSLHLKLQTETSGLFPLYLTSVTSLSLFFNHAKNPWTSLSHCFTHADNHTHTHTAYCL